MTTRVSLLGEMRIDPRMKLPKKGKALLAYLALQPNRRANRGRLADLLWPYQNSEGSRHCLRNAMYDIRRSSTVPLMDVTFHDICLRDDVTVDTDDFQTLATSDRLDALEAACSLHRGPLLDGTDLNSEPWENWLSAERERFKDKFLRAMLRIVKLQSMSNRHEDAIMSGHRLLVVEPTCEAGHRNLMRAYVYAGRRSEALLHWSVCRRVLQRELNVEPSPETVKVAEWVRNFRESHADTESWERSTLEEVTALRARCEALEDAVRRAGLQVAA